MEGVRRQFLLGPKHVVVEYIVHIVYKLFCVLTANYTLYLFIEHNGDVTVKRQGSIYSGSRLL